MSSLEPLIRELIVGAPLGKLLGMSVEALEPERVAATKRKRRDPSRARLFR